MAVTTSGSKRITWIDLAKGFCIMLVVFTHVTGWVGEDFPFSDQAGAFRMPLYFILSGLFFKQYEGFVGFAKRKVNKLLIPFLFFFVVTVMLPYWVMVPDLKRLFAYPLKYLYLERTVMLNEPIWFLLCLFEVNLLFYLVQWLAGAISTKRKTWLVVAFSLILGCVGLTLGVTGRVIPFYLDTALSVLPFFAFGWWLFRYSDFLGSELKWQRDLLLAIVCLLILCFLAVPVRWSHNEIPRDAVWVVYLCGIAGTMLVLLISKALKHLPGVSYWGRYSIMVLCVHYPLLTILSKVLQRYISGVPLFIAVFVLTMLLCHLLIPVMRRFLPHVTAQKDVIPITTT